MTKEEINKIKDQVNRRIIAAEACGDRTQTQINEEIRLLNYIDKLEKQRDKAIDKLYCWGEALDPDFQNEMLKILGTKKVDD